MSVATEEAVTSPHKRGLIHFNPKYSHRNTEESKVASDKTGTGMSKDSATTPGFAKPRKYFDSADFFMREELKGQNKQHVHGSAESKKQNEGSSLASECQTCSSNSSNGSSDGMSRNTLPLILLRRSKESAMISSSDGTDTDQENLPTTVEVVTGVPRKVSPPPRSSSTGLSESELKDERHSRRCVTVCGDGPALEGSEYSVQYQRTPEEIRSLLMPRLTTLQIQDDSSLAGAAAIVSPTKVVTATKTSA